MFSGSKSAGKVAVKYMEAAKKAYAIESNNFADIIVGYAKSEGNRPFQDKARVLANMSDKDKKKFEKIWTASVKQLKKQTEKIRFPLDATTLADLLPKIKETLTSIIDPFIQALQKKLQKEKINIDEKLAAILKDIRSALAFHLFGSVNTKSLDSLFYRLVGNNINEPNFYEAFLNTITHLFSEPKALLSQDTLKKYVKMVGHIAEDAYLHNISSHTLSDMHPNALLDIYFIIAKGISENLHSTKAEKLELVRNRLAVVYSKHIDAIDLKAGYEVYLFDLFKIVDPQGGLFELKSKAAGRLCEYAVNIKSPSLHQLKEFLLKLLEAWKNLGPEFVYENFFQLREYFLASNNAMEGLIAFDLLTNEGNDLFGQISSNTEKEKEKEKDHPSLSLQEELVKRYHQFANKAGQNYDDYYEYILNLPNLESDLIEIKKAVLNKLSQQAIHFELPAKTPKTEYDVLQKNYLANLLNSIVTLAHQHKINAELKNEIITHLREAFAKTDNLKVRDFLRTFKDCDESPRKKFSMFVNGASSHLPGSRKPSQEKSQDKGKEKDRNTPLQSPRGLFKKSNTDSDLGSNLPSVADPSIVLSGSRIRTYSEEPQASSSIASSSTQVNLSRYRK